VEMTKPMTRQGIPSTECDGASPEFDRYLPRPPPPARVTARRPPRDPPMHYVDKPKPITPEGSLVEAKLGSRLDAI